MTEEYESTTTRSSFWRSLPGILRAVAAVIMALAALLTALHSMGLLRKLRERVEEMRPRAEFAFPDDVVVGRWAADNGLAVEISTSDSASRPEYLGKQGSRDSATSEYGELIWEFNRTDLGRYPYIGRHIWGGGKSDRRYWGDSGGLVLEVLDPNRIRVVYTDSRYKGGWVYKRRSAPESADRTAASE